MTGTALIPIELPRCTGPVNDNAREVSPPDSGAMIIHIINPMVPQIGARRFTHCAGLTVREAVERAGWALPPTTVLVRDGQLVRRCDWDGAPVGPRELVLLVTLPQGGKGGVSQILSVIAIIALTLASSGLAGGLLGAVGLDAGSSALFGLTTLGAIAQVGIVLGGTMLINALLPKPKSAANSNNSSVTQSPTYSLSAQSNTAQLLNPIPERFGRYKFLPDLAATPYFDFVNSNQELKVELVLGMGEFEIEEVGVANNPIWSDGDYTGTYPEIELLFMPPGTANTLFSDNVVTSADVSNIEIVGTNEDGYDWSGPYVLNPAGTLAQQLDIDFTVPGGLFAVDTSGNLKAATISFKVQVQTIDELATPVGDWTDAITESITLSTRDAIRTTYSAPLDPARYQVRFERTNAKATDLNTSDQAAILAMRGYLPNAPARTDVTGLAFKARATKNLNGDTAQQLYVIATRKLPIYDPEAKTWSDPTATRTISAAAAYLCRATNGLRKADNQVDLEKLWALEEIWTARGDTFDGAFDTADSAWTDLQAILRCGRAEPLRAGRYITFNRDEPKSAPSGAFSPANILAGSFSIDFATWTPSSTDALWIDYVDARNWQPNSVFCALPDSITDADDAPHLDTMVGITDRDQAWREGMFLVACNRWRRTFPNFRTELEGRAATRGSLVALAHWMPVWGASGQVLYLEEFADGDVLTLSEPWDSANTFNEDAKIITLVTPDGQTWGPVTLDLVDDGEETGRAQVKLLQAATITQGKYAGMQPRDWGVWDGDGLDFERPRCMFGTATQAPKNALIVSMTPETGNTVSVAAVLDDPRVHYADGTIPPLEGDTPTPPAEALIPTPAAPDDLIITAVTIKEISQQGGVLTPTSLGFVVAGAPDAVSFDLQYKWNDAIDYQPVVTGLERTFQISAIIGTLTLQVRAEGESGFGAWFDASYSAQGVPASPGTQGTDVVVSVTHEWNGATASFTWSADPSALSYTLSLEMKVHSGDGFVQYGTAGTSGIDYTIAGGLPFLGPGVTASDVRIGVKSVFASGAAPNFVYP